VLRHQRVLHLRLLLLLLLLMLMLMRLRLLLAALLLWCRLGAHVRGRRDDGWQLRQRQGFPRSAQSGGPRTHQLGNQECGKARKGDRLPDHVPLFLQRRQE
jgi:hypothetical protein